MFLHIFNKIYMKRVGVMDWKELYKQKLTTAEEAVKHIPSNCRVVTGHAAGEPTVVVDAMTANYMQYENVEVVHMVAMGSCGYCRPEMKGHLRHNALFVGGGTREAVYDGRADFSPTFFYEVPRLFKTELPVDVALIQVSPPDNHGYCSYGISCDFTKPAADCARLIIAQINDQMPRTFGDNFIHVSDIDYIVEVSEPLLELQPPEIGEVERAVGKYCAELIEDGSTLQLGIGAIPDAVLLSLRDKKDLGIHSEMFSDGVVELYNMGVINNSKKSIHKGKMVVTFLMGTKKLYEFVNDNPEVEMYPVDYVNDPMVVMKNKKMVSINSCLQVDLMGQICAESIGLKQFSGVGGQVDYIRGTAMSEDGISIIAMPSTASKGKLSRIVPVLDSGSAVTTSRNDVQYIVTEYGIANLKGKTLKQRAEALIKIAHPDFREDLSKEYESRFNGK